MRRPKTRNLWLFLTLTAVAVGIVVMGVGTAFATVPNYYLTVSLTVQNMPPGVEITDLSAHLVGSNGADSDYFFNASGLIGLGALDPGTYQVTGINCDTDPYDFYPPVYSPSSGQVTLDSAQPTGTIGVTVTWAIPTARYQQTDPKLVYLGSWSSSGDTGWKASGNSFASTSKTGAAVVAKFSGPEVKVVAKKCPWYGQAEISVDGGSAQTVDLYSSSQLWKQTVYTKTGLSTGEHTLTVKCLGTKSTASSGVSVCLDALDITGSLVQAPKTSRIQETDAKCAYVGAWTSSGDTRWLASGNSFKSTDAADGKVTVTFKGTYLSWLSRSTPWYGRAKVTVDGNTAQAKIVDLYSASTTWKKAVFNTGLLSDGTHTVVIERLGTKYGTSWGTAVAVDAFDLVLTP